MNCIDYELQTLDHFAGGWANDIIGLASMFCIEFAASTVAESSGSMAAVKRDWHDRLLRTHEAAAARFEERAGDDMDAERLHSGLDLARLALRRGYRAASGIDDPECHLIEVLRVARMAIDERAAALGVAVWFVCKTEGGDA